MREHFEGRTSLRIKKQNVAAWTTALRDQGFVVLRTDPYYRHVPQGFGRACEVETCDMRVMLVVEDPEDMLTGKEFRRIGLKAGVVLPETSWDRKVLDRQ